jgi:hypothetical protein
MASRTTLIRDLLFFLKNTISQNIEDPISSSRPPKSAFVLTSYPSRPPAYPIITLKVTNLEARRVGLATNDANITLSVEIRIWARNELEKDAIYTQLLDTLFNEQYSSNGSINNDFHDFNVTSSVEVDEPGDVGIKSRIMQCYYRFFKNT